MDGFLWYVLFLYIIIYIYTVYIYISIYGVYIYIRIPHTYYVWLVIHIRQAGTGVLYLPQWDCHLRHPRNLGYPWVALNSMPHHHVFNKVMAI